MKFNERIPRGIRFNYSCGSSEIDNYLENDWYNSLSSTMKAAIQTTSIKQVSYKTFLGSMQETGYNGQVYNTISRHVFLPSVNEIGKAVYLYNTDKVKAFLNGALLWTRDSSRNYSSLVSFLYGYYGTLDSGSADRTLNVRPAFVIDLSQVDYKVAGHTDYK